MNFDLGEYILFIPCVGLMVQLTLVEFSTQFSVHKTSNVSGLTSSLIYYNLIWNTFSFMIFTWTVYMTKCIYYTDNKFMTWLFWLKIHVKWNIVAWNELSLVNEINTNAHKILLFNCTLHVLSEMSISRSGHEPWYNIMQLNFGEKTSSGYFLV